MPLGPPGEEPKYAFAFCKALQQVTVAWDTPLAVPDKTFWGVNTANVPLKVPKGKEAEYQAAPVWKSFKSREIGRASCRERV